MVLKSSFKKKLLLFLASGLNFWDQYLSYSATRYWLYFGRWRKSTIYNTISQLLSVGEIEKVVKKGEIFLRLTSKGNEKFKQDIPFFKYSKEPWDGYWRLVIFDIPEKKRVLRDVLRRKLASLTFGQWQKSVYITPFDLEEEINQFLKAQKLFGFSFCLKAKRLGEGDDKEIARIAFKLDKLNDEYYKLIEEIEELEFSAEKGKLKPKFLQFLIDKYFDLILKDPGLPKELLPKIWLADEAKKAFKTLLINLEKFRK